MSLTSSPQAHTLPPNYLNTCKYTASPSQRKGARQNSSNTLRCPLLRHKGNNLCQNRALRTGTGRSYRPFPLREVCHLPRLWISPLEAIPQRGRNPRLIYDFVWSGLNEALTQVDHKEAMRFVKSLYRVIDCIRRTQMRM